MASTTDSLLSRFMALASPRAVPDHTPEPQEFVDGVFILQRDLRFPGGREGRPSLMAVSG